MNMKSEKNKFRIIIVIVLLNSIGMSIILPLLPFLIGKYLPSQQVVVGMSLLMSVFAACMPSVISPIVVKTDFISGFDFRICSISMVFKLVSFKVASLGISIWIMHSPASPKPKASVPTKPPGMSM